MYIEKHIMCYKLGNLEKKKKYDLTSIIYNKSENITNKCWVFDSLIRTSIIKFNVSNYVTEKFSFHSTIGLITPPARLVRSLEVSRGVELFTCNDIVIEEWRLWVFVIKYGYRERYIRTSGSRYNDIERSDISITKRGGRRGKQKKKKIERINKTKTSGTETEI